MLGKLRFPFRKGQAGCEQWGVHLAGSFQLLAPLESASACKGARALFCAAPSQWLSKADGGSRAYASHPTQNCSNGHSLSHSSWSGGQKEFVRTALCSSGSPGHSYFFPFSFHQCYPSVSLSCSSLHFNTCFREKPTCNCTLRPSRDSTPSTHMSCTSRDPVLYHLHSTAPAKTAFHMPMTFNSLTLPHS